MAAQNAPPAVLQSAVGCYQLASNQSLGHGSYGSVYLYREARDESKHVAVKRIPLTGLLNDERGRLCELLERELTIHHALSHPHIVKMRDVILELDHLNIVMEYVKGQNLFEHLRTLPVRYTEDVARVLFQQLIVALDYLHAKGAAHRDIKLENTLLQLVAGSPILKLADFGFGRSGLGATTIGIGSPRYRAPEVITVRSAAAPAAAATAATAAAAAAAHNTTQHNADSANGHAQAATYDAYKVDVWTAGVLLYAILHGEYPFPEQTGPEAAWLSTLQQGPRWRDCVVLSEGCKDLLLQMLQYDPTQRITVSGIMQHQWFTAQLEPNLQELISKREQHLAQPSPCALSYAGLQAVIQQLKQRLAKP